ncbi:helix-turn-helix domain-containing protein [Marinobacterium rhizophilum]|uniref:helix-turn-helix domain-containing protein n=1 Tax=Marinobacterium rhizophilum TaxID=420402 RepID=UPI00035E7531
MTGIHHRRNETNLIQLVHDAVKCDVAGLVILAGSEYIQKIPSRILEHAAEYLGIHRNTLRFKRIEKLIGHNLNDSFSRLNVQNVLLIEQIIFLNQNIGS